MYTTRFLRTYYLSYNHMLRDFKKELYLSNFSYKRICFGLIYKVMTVCRRKNEVPDDNYYDD